MDNTLEIIIPQIVCVCRWGEWGLLVRDALCYRRLYVYRVKSMWDICALAFVVFLENFVW